MTKARIYAPSKNAMQSGRARADGWILEYQGSMENEPESLMGWSSATDTLGQIRLKFKDLESAKSYAQSKGLAYTVAPAHKRKLKPRNYVDNFRYIEPEETAKKS